MPPTNVKISELFRVTRRMELVKRSFKCKKWESKQDQIEYGRLVEESLYEMSITHKPASPVASISNGVDAGLNKS